MPTVTSSDGTSIAYDRIGAGPPLILVDGALCYRDNGPNGDLAKELSGHFTVYTYDRRGRGHSGDTPPYAPEREIEDVAALIQEAGGAARVYGISSGAALALEAANSGLPITKLALYEAPFIVDSTRAPIPSDYEGQLNRKLGEGREGDAVRLFMTKGVGLPRPMVALMRFMPAWRKLKSVAHTLPYDAAFVGEFQSGEPLPEDRWKRVSIPTAVIDGGKSPEWMRNGMRALSEALPNAEYRTLEGQTHLVKAKVLAPELIDFLAG